MITERFTRESNSISYPIDWNQTMRDMNYPDNRSIKSHDGIKTFHLFRPMIFELSDRILIITTWKRVSWWKRTRFSNKGSRLISVYCA